MDKYGFLFFAVLFLSVACVLSTLIYCVNRSNVIAYQEIGKMVASGANPISAECAIWELNCSSEHNQ